MAPRRLAAPLLALLVSTTLGACKTASALEEATADLPPSELVHERRNAQPGASRHARRAPPRQQGSNVASPGPGPGPGPEVGPTPQGPPEPWKGNAVNFDGELILLGGPVGFSDDHLQVDAKGQSVLDEVATMLEARPALTQVEVQAHLDARASGDHNKTTQMRADTVRTYLVSAGVDATRVVAKGYGSEVPIDTNRTEEGRQANRRVEIVVRAVHGKQI